MIHVIWVMGCDDVLLEQVRSYKRIREFDESSREIACVYLRLLDVQRVNSREVAGQGGTTGVFL